jgi:hypothetical protein
MNRLFEDVKESFERYAKTIQKKDDDETEKLQLMALQKLCDLTFLKLINGTPVSLVPFGSGCVLAIFGEIVYQHPVSWESLRALQRLFGLTTYEVASRILMTSPQNECWLDRLIQELSFEEVQQLGLPDFQSPKFVKWMQSSLNVMVRERTRVMGLYRWKIDPDNRTYWSCRRRITVTLFSIVCGAVVPPEALFCDDFQSFCAHLFTSSHNTTELIQLFVNAGCDTVLPLNQMTREELWILDKAQSKRTNDLDSMRNLLEKLLISDLYPLIFSYLLPNLYVFKDSMALRSWFRSISSHASDVD